MIEDPTLITEEDKKFLDENPTVDFEENKSLIEKEQKKAAELPSTSKPLQVNEADKKAEEAKQEAAKTDVPKVPDEEEVIKNYDFLGIKANPNINPFTKINQREFVNADQDKRDEIVSGLLAELNQNLTGSTEIDEVTGGPKFVPTEVPSLRKKIVDGKEVEEQVNVPASDRTGRLTKAGLDYYNQMSALLSAAAKDKNGGIRRNPLTGEIKPRYSSKQLLPYTPEEKEPTVFAKDESGVEYTPLTEENVVSYDHVRQVYATRAKQAGMSLSAYMNNVIENPDTLDEFNNTRSLVAENIGVSYQGEFNNDKGLEYQIKNSPIKVDDAKRDELQAGLVKSTNKLLAEVNMGDKLATMYDGKPIFNTEKIRKLDDFEEAIQTLPISKTEKQSLLLNFKTNFESQALDIIQRLDAAEQGIDFLSGFNPITIGDQVVSGLLGGDPRFVTSTERFAESGMSAYDFLKANSDEFDSNIIASGIEKFALATLDSFDSTRTGLLSLGAGLAQTGVQALPGAIAYGDVGSAVTGGLEEFRKDLAEGKSVVTEMKRARTDVLGKINVFGEEGDPANITTDDIFDAAGNIAEMYLTLGQSTTLKTLGTLGSRKLSIAASREAGKKAAAQSMKDFKNVGLAESKLLGNTGNLTTAAVNFKEGARALWENAASLNTTANVIKTSLYGSFTSAGGGVGEGYTRAIKQGKNEDEALVEASATGLSNGLATFVAMTVMNGLFPSFGVEKGLIKASEGIGLRTAIANTIAKNKSSKVISNALKELRDDITNLKAVSSGTAAAVSGISKSSGLMGFGKSVVFGSLVEGIEEWGDELLSPVINTYLMKNENTRKQLEEGGHWVPALKAGIIGMMMGGVTAFATRTTDAQKSAIETANKYMENYIKKVIPKYEGMMNERVRVKEESAPEGQAERTLKEILSTGTVAQKVQALTELGRQKIEQPNLDRVSNANQTLIIDSTATPDLQSNIPNVNTDGNATADAAINKSDSSVVTPTPIDETKSNLKESSTAEVKSFEVSRTKSTAKTTIKAPVSNEKDLPYYAYRQAHGTELKTTDVADAKLEVSDVNVFKKEGGNITVSSYSINGQAADLHSFEDVNGDTVFVNKGQLGKALTDSFGNKIVLSDLSKIKNDNQIALQIKVPKDSANLEVNQSSSVETSQKKETTIETPQIAKTTPAEETNESSEQQSNQQESQSNTKAKPEPKVEEKIEDIYNDDVDVVGEKKLKPRFKKVFDRYKAYFKKKNIAVIFVNDISELKKIWEAQGTKGPFSGLAITLNEGKPNQRDAIIIVTDLIEQSASATNGSLEEIIETTLAHENFHVETFRYDRTKEGAKLKKGVEQDLFNNEQLNKEMDKDYPGYSLLDNRLKFYEFTRAFVSGKLTKKTLGLMTAISPSIKKWVKGFIKFAKKELKNYGGAKKYLSGLEKSYIEAIKDDASLFGYSGSSTEAFKNFISNTYSKIKPAKSRKRSKVLVSRDVDYNLIEQYVELLNESIASLLGKTTDPKSFIDSVVATLDSYAVEGVGISPDSKKIIFDRIVEDWKNTEIDQNMLNALQATANQLGSVDNAPHMENPAAPASKAVMTVTEERLAYNQYTQIRRSVDESLVVTVKNEITSDKALANIEGRINEDQTNSVSNAYILAKTDQTTGEIISLGYEVGDVISVVNPRGDITKHLVYVNSDIVVLPNGKTEARHQFISGVVSENGKLTPFGAGLQTMFSSKFRKDFEESGLVEKMFEKNTGALTLKNIDSLLEFVFQSLTTKSLNDDGSVVNNIEIAGKKYTFNDLFNYDASSTLNDKNESPFYYSNGKIVVNTEALRKEFSFINESILKDQDSKKTIGLLIAQAVRTAIDEELLHHITTLTFKPEDLASLYDDLYASGKFNGLLVQIANAQGIYTQPENLTNQERLVIATEFLAFINQKSFDGATYADQYNQLLRSYAYVNPDGTSLAIATLYGKRFKDILIARSATSLMAPRLVDMVNKLSTVRSTLMPTGSSSNMANVYANFNEAVYTNAKNRMQKVIDDAFLKQHIVVNDLRSFLYERRMTPNGILNFNFENNTVDLTPSFKSFYERQVTPDEMKELNDYFSRLNKDSVVREFLSTLSAARTNLDALTEQVAANVEIEGLGQRFREATENYNNLVLSSGDIILNKNLTKVDDFGRSFNMTGVELGGEVVPNFSTGANNLVTIRFTTPVQDGEPNITDFTYEANMFGYENQSPTEAISGRSARRRVFAELENNIERAKTDTLWFMGYRGRFTSDDRNNFAELVANRESNAANLGEEEFNFFYISRINGEKFVLNKKEYSNTDFRKMMGFNIIGFQYGTDGERISKSFNEVVNKIVFSDEELQIGFSDSNGKPYTTTLRTISQSDLIKKSPERQRTVLTGAMQLIFGKENNVVTWFENLENLIKYDRQNGTYSVIEEISGKETFANKFAKQLIYRMFDNKLTSGIGIRETMDKNPNDIESLYEMLREYQSAYHSLFPSVKRPDDVKKVSIAGANVLSDIQVNDLLEKLPVFLEAVDALNQDIGLARKAYTRFTSSYLLNTIKGDIRLVQEQNTDGLRANEQLLRAIQYSFYDIQAMEDIEFLMEYRNNGGRHGINGIIALNLLDQLAGIPSSAQNEYFVANTPSQNVRYLLDRYATYLENGLNPRTKDADGKSTYPTDNLVFNTLQQYGNRPNEQDEEFSDDRATKPSDTSETLTMSGVAPVTGRDEASQEAIDSARREAMHEEIKKMKSWTTQAAIAIFQKIAGKGNSITIDGIDTVRVKTFFNLFAKIQNRPTMENDFNEDDYSQLKKDHQELNALMLEQLKALANHYKITNSPDPKFAEIADKVRKSAYTHPMEFLVDVVEVIGVMERAYITELESMGKTLADFTLTQLKKETAFSNSAIKVDSTTTSFVDTSALQEKLNVLINAFDRELDNPFASLKIINRYKEEISKIENEIATISESNLQNLDTEIPIRRYVKKDTTSLRKKLEEEDQTLEMLKEQLIEAQLEGLNEKPIQKSINNQQSRVKTAQDQLNKAIAENEKADQQVKTPMEDLQSQYQELKSKLYTAQQKTTTDEAGNVVGVTSQRLNETGQIEQIPINELVANPEVEAMMNRIGVMIAQLQNQQEKPASMISYNQEQAQLVLDSMQEDSDKGKLGPGTIFYSRTFKFKSEQSLIDDRLFTKSPLFSTLIQSMPNLIVYQPNTNYEGKKHHLPDGAGLVQLSNGDNVLYITNPDQLNNSKQAEILELLVISQIRNESDSGNRPSILQQTINEMASVVRKQAEHAVNMTPDRIAVLVARAEQVINNLNTIDQKLKTSLIDRYRKSLENSAAESIKLLTDQTARRKYIEDRVTRRSEGVSTFFSQLVTGNKEAGTSSTIADIQLIVDMFTNPDAYRLLSTFKSPDLDFNGLAPLPQYDALLAQALSLFAINEIQSSEIHDISLQKSFQAIDEARSEFDDDDTITDPALIYEAIANNFSEEKRTGRKITKPEIIRLIKQMSDSQIKEVIDPLILERYFTTERSPDATKQIHEAFKQNIAQPDFLYRYVGSQIMRAMEPTLTSADPSIKETSIFDEAYPSNLAGREQKAYDLLYARNKPILLSTMLDPARSVDSEENIGETRVPTGNITNFYYGHNPMTEVYRMNRRKNLLGMLLGNTTIGKDILDEIYNDEMLFSTESFVIQQEISIDEYPGILANMIEDLPSLLGDDVVTRANEIVDRIDQLSRSNRQQAKDRIAELQQQLQKVKQEGREFLLEKLIERNKQVMDVVKSQLLFDSKEADTGLDEDDAKSTLRSIADRVANYIISERAGLHKNSHNLSQKLKSNANRYLKSYKASITNIYNIDNEITNLLNGRFNDNNIVNNDSFKNLLARRNALVTQAELFRSEYSRIAAMELMGELVNPAYAFGIPNGDVQAYINRTIGGMINFGKIGYKNVTPFDENSTPSAVYRSISNNLITSSKKNSAIISANRAMSPGFASELLSGITSREAAELFSSLGPDINKNFAVQNGYLDTNFKSEMVKEFFSRLKGEGVISKYAKEISKKVKEDITEDGIRRFVRNELSKNSKLSKLFADEFIITDIESSASQDESRIFDGNIDAKIEKINNEIDRLTHFLNSNQNDTNQIRSKDLPQVGRVTLFEIPSYRYPDQDIALSRMNQGFPAARKVNVKLTRTLNESELSTEQLALADAINRDAKVINEAINLFLEEEGEGLYKALTEEIDMFGEGVDIKQNINNVIELTKLKRDLSEQSNTRFELMLKELSEIDDILNEAEQPSLELYGMTLRDMIKLDLYPAVVVSTENKNKTESQIKTEIQMINEEIAKKSEVDRIKQTALFIKNQAGIAVFMPTEGKLKEKEGRSYLMYDRAAITHLRSLQKITKQKGKPQDLLKDAIFRASRGAVGFDSYLRTQIYEDISVDMDGSITPELAIASGVDPKTTRREFIVKAKRLFNEYFFKEIGNYVVSSFAKGIGVYGTIKRAERMNDDQINKAFDDIHDFASDAANDAILQSSGFGLLTKAKQDYTAKEKADIVKSAFDIVIQENKFLTPDSHASNSILMNEALFEDVILMLESERFAKLNTNKTLGAYQEAAINAIASVFTNEANTANSTSGKYFDFNTAIARLDLRQNYSRLYSLLYAQDILTDLYSGVIAAEEKDNNSWFTHSNALIRQKFARKYGAYERALALQGLIEQGINGNAGRNKSTSKYQDYQARIGKAASAIGNDFDLGARAYMVAVTRGIIEANKRDGGSDLDLAMKLHYFATAYNNGIRDHNQAIENKRKYKADGSMFERGKKLFTSIARKQSREDANLQVIDDLIGSEIIAIAYNNPRSLTRQDVQSYIDRIENLLYSGFDSKTVSNMDQYANALVEEFTEIYEGHRMANAFASEESLRGIEEIVDPNVGKTAKTFRNSYSVIPLRFGHVRNPLVKKDPTVGNGTPTIDSFINFEQSLMNYKGRSIRDIQNEDFVRVLRPLDLNPFTAPDQIANDAIYRMYLNPSYTIIRKMLGEYGVDVNGIAKTEKGHLVGALKAIYSIGNDQNLTNIGQYGQISAYIMDKINTEIRNDMPMDLADSLLADFLRVSNIHFMVKALGSMTQILSQGAFPALAKYINIKAGNWMGLHKKSGMRLLEAYTLAFIDYFSIGLTDISRFVKENSINSFKWIADGANKRDSQISMTKYASQNHLTYLSRFLGANFNKLGEGFLDFTIGKPERALVKAIYTFELFSELQKNPATAPKTIREMLKMNPDQISSYAKTKADNMVTDFMGIGDRAKKAKVYNLPKNQAIWTLLLNSLTRFGNHSLTVGPNMMVNMNQIYNSGKMYGDRQMRAEAIENVMGTVLQTLLFRFGQFNILLPNLVWLYYAIGGALGGDKDDEDERSATIKTKQLLRSWDVNGEVEKETDTFLELLSRRARGYFLPREFAVNKKYNRDAKFLWMEFKNSPILENNLVALRKSMLDTLPAISYIKAGSVFSVPLFNSAIDASSEINMMMFRGEKDFSDLAKIVQKTQHVDNAPIANLISAYKGGIDNASVPLNYFLPKNGKKGASFSDFIEGMFVAPFGSREYRPVYYERMRKKGGWGIERSD